MSFNYAPFHLGGSTGSIAETILESLNQGDGTGVSTDVDSFNYCENLAISRAIAEAWSTHRRLINQFSPQTMTGAPFGFLDRWEALLGLSPLPTDSEAERRAAVAAKFLLVGQAPNQQGLYDLLQQIIPSIFVGIVNQDASIAVGNIEGGLSITGGATLLDGPWSSSVSYVAIEVMQPVSMGDLEFFETAGKIYQFLDSFLPVWVDYGWFKNGDQGDGFFLDEDNLDIEGF